jgi:hypothetical protein
LLCWVAFIKVLTVYQLYHTWIHPSTPLLYPSCPIRGIIPACIIFAFTYMHTHFLHYSPSYPLPLHLPPPTGASPSPWAGHVLSFCSSILQKRKEKENCDIFVCLK